MASNRKRYSSVFKLRGVPILPPILTAQERAEMKKYKEAALKKEQELAVRLTTSQNSDNFEESQDSTLQTEEVVEFIRKALMETSHIDEVKQLQNAIIDELQKFHQTESCDTADTLHYLDDISNDDRLSSFSDLSPIKTDLQPLEEPNVCLAIPGPSKESPPKLIRSNSYTLESPSPSVLAYLKSLGKENSLGDITLKKKCVAKNLNEVYESVQDNFSNMDLGPSFTNFSFSTQDSYSGASNASTQSNTLENNNTSPEIERAASIIQAGVRGYLTRRLMKTKKVIELKNTIRDSLITALQLHTETSLKPADLELHQQLLAQVEKALWDWYDIFFEISTRERMKIIEMDRNRAKFSKIVRNRKISEKKVKASASTPINRPNQLRINMSSTQRSNTR